MGSLAAKYGTQYLVGPSQLVSGKFKTLSFVIDIVKYFLFYMDNSELILGVRNSY